MKAAELFVKCLENEGVGVVFGVPGEENVDIVDALLGVGSNSLPHGTSKAPRLWPMSTAGLPAKPAFVCPPLGPGRPI
jgi:acetolactate synthase-1/2/3 large subunit